MLKVQSKREGSSKTPNKIELKSAKSPRNKPAALKTSPQPSPLFHSKKFKVHFKKQSFMSEHEVAKWSIKVMTTDESNNGLDSKCQQSLVWSDKRLPNEEYFNEPLTFKNKKQKNSRSKIRLQNLSNKLGQINRLVSSQQKEFKTLKNVLSQKELHRLNKMHSIEKLKLVEQICGESRELKKSRS